MEWGAEQSGSPYSADAIWSVMQRYADTLTVVREGSEALAVLSTPTETFDGVASQLILLAVKPSVDSRVFLEKVKTRARQMGATRLIGVTHRLHLTPASEYLIARYGAVPDGVVLSWRLV